MDDDDDDPEPSPTDEIVASLTGKAMAVTSWTSLFSRLLGVGSDEIFPEEEVGRAEEVGRLTKMSSRSN